MKDIKVAIIGYGGIARLHYAAYCALEENGYPIHVVAVCDRDADRIFQRVEVNLGGDQVELSEGTHIYTDITKLIGEEPFDMADVCLPTFLHKDVSIQLLSAGKHVLCEKPMALHADDCAEMVRAASMSGCRLMIGQCLRFDGTYRYLKSCIDDGRFGTLRYLTLERHCDYPSWASDFQNFDKTGGCILDTHIHDIDIARYLLGEPSEVSAVWYNSIPHCQLVHSRLIYPETAVLADVAWDEARTVSFASGFHAKFDKASVDCDGATVTVKPWGGERYEVSLDTPDRMYEELRSFAELVSDSTRANTENPPESAMGSVCLIEALRRSAELNGLPVKM